MLLIKTRLNYDSVPDVVCALYVTELSMIYHRDHAIVAREKSTLHHQPTTHRPSWPTCLQQTLHTLFILLRYIFTLHFTNLPKYDTVLCKLALSINQLEIL